MRHDGDETLVARARRGDETAFARLVERHYGLIFRIAWRWSRDRSDAEDIAQDVCVKLAHAIASFRGESAFSTWLTRMTINAAKDLARARARRVRDVAALALVPEDGAPCEATRQAEEESSALWRAVDALPARQRDAMLLVYAEGMKHADAARALGCREGTLSWHVHQARKTLQRQLRDERDE
jgi:RNA polymerase sigma-70 factor (ECF subfamily)